MAERLQKWIAARGVASRRAVEAMIEQGRVQVNGHPAVLGMSVGPKDEILIDGKPLPEAPKQRYILLHKPRGYVTTLSDERGRRTVAELVADCGERVYPVGRLDYDSEGLLLMTNDGDLMQRLLHPSHEVNKTYHVSVYGAVAGCVKRLSALRDLEGDPIRPAQVEVLRQTGQTAELVVTIHEGKNRQVRRMCAACGLNVKRLRRVREHTLELGELAPGQWRYLTEAEVEALKQA